MSDIIASENPVIDWVGHSLFLLLKDWRYVQLRNIFFWCRIDVCNVSKRAHHGSDHWHHRSKSESFAKPMKRTAIPHIKERRGSRLPRIRRGVEMGSAPRLAPTPEHERQNQNEEVAYWFPEAGRILIILSVGKPGWRYSSRRWREWLATIGFKACSRVSDIIPGQ